MQNHIVIPPQSPSAIPIVAPSDAAVNSSTTSTINKPLSNKPVAKGVHISFSFSIDTVNAHIATAISFSLGNANAKRLCRNVIIHGFCKFEGKGCEFNHEVVRYSRQLLCIATEISKEMNTYCRYRTNHHHPKKLQKSKKMNHGKASEKRMHKEYLYDVSNGKVRLPRTGSGVFSSMSAESINAPVFVPKSTPITVSAATTASSSMTASPLVSNTSNNVSNTSIATSTAGESDTYLCLFH